MFRMTKVALQDTVLSTVQKVLALSTAESAYLFPLKNSIAQHKN
jgi:hypothetical protein